VRLMQPEAQTTTRDSIAVSAGALEIAIVIQGVSEVLSLNLFCASRYRVGSIMEIHLVAESPIAFHGHVRINLESTISSLSTCCRVVVQPPRVAPAERVRLCAYRNNTVNVGRAD